MENDSRTVLEYMDKLSASLGYRDFAALRARIGRGLVQLRNMVEDASVVAAMTDAEVRNCVDKLEQPACDSALKFLRELESHAPAIRTFISKLEGMDILTGSRVGRPPTFKDRETEREVCRKVLAEIAKGFSEAESKRRVASKLKIDGQTINRTWKNRGTIAELSVPEVFARLLALWQTGTLWQADRSNQSEEPK